MLVTRFLCPFVGCYHTAEVRNPSSDSSVYEARNKIAMHRHQAHRGAKSVLDSTRSQRWEYDGEGGR